MAISLTARSSEKTKSWIALIALLLFLPLLIFGVFQVSTLISRAAAVPANIVVDTTLPMGMVNTDFMKAFAQGGEENTNQLAPVLSELRALRPKIIRLDHIYDHYDVVSRSGTQLTFDWKKLDDAVDTIRASGATPLLALSYMPQAISSDGTVIGTPTSWDEWALTVQKTIEHYSGKSGKNIQGVYYEVWNEPDLPIFGKWSLKDPKNYLTMYQFASFGAQRAANVQTFYLGGPVTTGLYKNWVMALVGSGYRLDFLSWHSYLKDPTKFASDQQNIRSWLSNIPHAKNLPLIISEIGFTGDKDPRYSTLYAAAHTAAVTRQLLADAPKYVFSFEIKDGPGQGDGQGWGLLTHESAGKKPKPRYKIYSWLDQMNGPRLGVSGEGTYVTAIAGKRSEVIQLMLINFSLDENHTEAVPVTFTNLTPGRYSIRQKYLDGQDTTVTQTSEGTILKKLVYMPSYSVHMLELTKIP